MTYPTESSVLRVIDDFPPTKYHRISVSNPSKSRGSELKIGYHVYPCQSKSKSKLKSIPLFMITGWTAAKEDWHSLAFELSRTRTVIAHDNRGMGESILYRATSAGQVPFRGVPSFSLTDLADDVSELIKHVHGERHVDVLGLSMGGMITQELVNEHPHLVRRAVLYASAPGGGRACPYQVEKAAAQEFTRLQSGLAKVRGDKEKMKRELGKLNKMMLPKGWDDKEGLAKLVDMSLMTRRPGKVVMGQLSAILKFDNKAKLAKMRTPVLICHGTFDRVLDYRNALHMYRHIPFAQLCTLEGEGHMIHCTRFGLTTSVSAINRFLSEDVRHDSHSTHYPIRPVPSKL